MSRLRIAELLEALRNRADRKTLRGMAETPFPAEGQDRSRSQPSWPYTTLVGSMETGERQILELLATTGPFPVIWNVGLDAIDDSSVEILARYAEIDTPIAGRSLTSLLSASQVIVSVPPRSKYEYLGGPALQGLVRELTLPQLRRPRS